MNEWKEYKLGDIAKIQTGPFGSQLHASDYVSEGIPSIMPTNIGQRLEISRSNLSFINEEDAKRLERYLVKTEDIVYSRRGDVEKCAFITTKENGWLCGTGCLRVSFVSNNVLPKFVAYYLSTDEIKGWISSNAVGTTMPNLNSGILERLPLSLPALPEQRAIASVLTSLDDKIDLLHRQNATLEALAETLFRQWFVEEAEESWEKGKLGDFVDLNPKRTLKGGSIAPYLEMSNVSNQVYHPDNWYDREFFSGTKFINGDTLLARITPCLENGKSAYVDFLENEQVGWGSTEYIVMRPKPFLHTFFSYVLTRNEDFRSYAIASMVGSSGRQRVDINSLADYEISLPTHETIEKFNSFCEGSLQKMKHNHIEIRTLTQLRDTLLPKLMSGEVRVSETSNQA